MLNWFSCQGKGHIFDFNFILNLTGRSLVLQQYDSIKSKNTTNTVSQHYTSNTITLTSLLGTFYMDMYSTHTAITVLFQGTTQYDECVLHKTCSTSHCHLVVWHTASVVDTYSLPLKVWYTRQERYCTPLYCIYCKSVLFSVVYLVKIVIVNTITIYCATWNAWHHYWTCLCATCSSKTATTASWTWQTSFHRSQSIILLCNTLWQQS